MMTSQALNRRTWMAAGALILSLGACGEDPALQCPSGTVRNGAGECVRPAQCPAGTLFNAQTNTCDPVGDMGVGDMGPASDLGPEDCLPDQRYDVALERCVPDGPGVCPNGGMRDPDSMLCRSAEPDPERRQRHSPQRL